MSLTMDSVSLLNPKLRHNHIHIHIHNHSHRHASNSNSLTFHHSSFAPPFLSLHPIPRTSTAPFNLAFASPHNHSKHGEIEAENETDESRIGSEESQEAWKQALDTLREQALKIQCISQEAYELYSKKAIVVLRDTTEQLKIEADWAAKEISEEGKQYLTAAAEKSPEVKDIVETFTSPADDLSEISEIRDFYVGIPYGFVLSLSGFVAFMVTGSITAIRFGMILGGVHLALGISSLRSYKRGEPSTLALKGQAAIASILFLREISLLVKGSSLVTYFTALISGAVVAFYVYRMVLAHKHQKGSNLESETES